MKTDHGQLKPTRAWMGGDRPRAWLECSPQERAKAAELWREQCGYYIGAWGDLLPPSSTCPISGRPVSRLSMARLFWSRARYDAHASYR